MTNESKEKYYVRAVCLNCGNTQLLAIEKGTEIVYVLRHQHCDNCGCNKLTKTI